MMFDFIFTKVYNNFYQCKVARRDFWVEDFKEILVGQLDNDIVTSI